MSQVPQKLPQALSLSEKDVQKMLAAEVHIGTENLDVGMSRYVWKRRPDAQYIINLQYTWEKIVLAARMIVAVENPKDICAISARDWGQRAVLKFSSFTGATGIAGRFTPGTFTNQQQQKDFKEPRLLIVTDTRVDHQPLTEASYVNIPTIAFCNTDSPIRYVDVVIPCNNAGPHSIGLIYWLLSREVQRLRGQISRAEDWNVMPDLFFWRDPAEVEKEEGIQETTGGSSSVAPVATFGGFEGQSTTTQPATSSQTGAADWGLSDSGSSSVQPTTWGGATGGAVPTTIDSSAASGDAVWQL